MFDIDIGKFISRSLGIGEESTDEAVKLGTAIATGDIFGGVVASSQLLASEKARKQTESPMGSVQAIEEAKMYETGRNMYRTTVAQESGGYIDIPSTGQIYEGFVGQIPNILGQVFRTLPSVSRSDLPQPADWRTGSVPPRLRDLQPGLQVRKRSLR